jgi:hypothetical protein
MKPLANGLAHVANGRHMMVWAAAPNIQAKWETAGAAGQMETNDVMASLLNFAGNKLGWFFKGEEHAPAASWGWLNGRHDHDAREQREPQRPVRVLGRRWGDVAPNEYSALATVNLPAAASGATMNCNPKPDIAGRVGPTYVLGQTVKIDQGKSQDVIVRFRVPGAHGQLRIVPAGRVPDVSWERQDKFTETGIHTV